MFTYHVWPDGTVCRDEDLDEYLRFMSDDFVTCVTTDEDIDSAPTYDRIIAETKKE